MKGSEALVRMLDQAGVEVVFGLCGDTTLPLYEAWYDINPSMQHVLCRDERSASYMAEAYARFSGRVGVCEGPSGGGVTYIIPGVAEANQSSVPLVCITSDIDVRDRDRGTLTEFDQDAIFRPLTTWTKTPSHSTELPRTVREMFRRAVGGRMGATHLGLAMNVQEGEVPDADVYMDPATIRYPFGRTAPDPAGVKTLAAKLTQARNPLIVAGAGVMRSEAWDELKALVDLLGCPVATSISGKGAMAETDPLCLGVVGSNGGLPWRHDLLLESDLIFFIGCHTGSVTTNKWTLPPDRSREVIQLDLDATRLGVNYELSAGLVADAKLGLAALAQEVGDLLSGKPAGKFDPARIARAREADLAERWEFGSDDSPIWPERFIAELGQALPDDGLIITDPGTPTPYVAGFHRLPRAGRYFAAPRAHGALGYALPAVIGASFARPGAPVIGIMGDGSFGISAGELETIARLGRPVVLVVMTNAIYGWVKAGQKGRGRKYFAVDFGSLDHARVAQAFGLEAVRVEQAKDLGPALKKALAAKGPVLLDVLTHPLDDTRAPVSKWIA